MNAIRCSECGDIIFSDDDPDCFWDPRSDLPEWEGAVCERCREGMIEYETELRMPGKWHEQ